MEPAKTALVLFAHGARDARWAEPLARLRTDLLRYAPQLRVELAFLELQAPGLAETLDGLAADGCRGIVVAPIFWSMGAHAARDLPQLVASFAQRHPEAQLRVLPVLADLPGMDAFLARALLAQMPGGAAPASAA